MKLLAPFARIYAAIMSRRNRAYDRGQKDIYQAPVPVVSIGNLSMGGTGKTPMAEYLLARLLEEGKSVAYLSRGYGRKTKGFRWVDSQSETVLSVGDEALQVALKFREAKVVVCEDRAAGVRRLLAERQIDLILLDDAFQHRRMGRDLDLVMIDAKRLPTRNAVLPQGRLREPLSGLSRADFLIVNRVDDVKHIPLIKQELAQFQKPMAFCRPRMQGVQAFGEAAIQDLSWLQGKKVVAFSGIGNHPYFVERLAAAGAQVVAERRYRDHYRYREHDVKQLAALRSDEAILLTTEKDYCRLQTMVDGAPWYYVPIELDWWEGEERIWDSFCKIPSP